MARDMSESYHSPLSGANDYYFDRSCDQCDQDGRNVEAKGYCCDCPAFLCQECYDTHLRPRTMRHHVLLDENKMPEKDQTNQSNDVCIEPCDVHPEEKLKYVCYTHKNLSCVVCIALNHRNCEGVDYIPDVAEGILTSKEYGDFQRRITDLTSNTQSSVQISQDKAKESHTLNNDVHEAMKKFRKDVNDALDRIEETVLPDADKITAEDEIKMRDLEDKLKDILHDVQAVDARVTSLKKKGQLCQMFIAVNRSPADLAALEDRLADHSKQAEIQNYAFAPSEEANTLLKSPDKMARLEKVAHIMPQTNSNVKHSPVLEPAADPKLTSISRRKSFLDILVRRGQPGSTGQNNTAVADRVLKPGNPPIAAVFEKQTKVKQIQATFENNALTIGADSEKKTQMRARSPRDTDKTSEHQLQKDVAAKPLAVRQETAVSLPSPQVQATYFFNGKAQQPTQPALTSSSEKKNADGEKKLTPAQFAARGQKVRKKRKELEELRTKNLLEQAKGISSELKLQKEVTITPKASVPKPAAVDRPMTLPPQPAPSLLPNYRPQVISTAEHVMDINVRATGDHDTPDITGSVLLPGGRLIIVDFNNSKVKLVQLAYIKITAELKLSLWIWDIAQISDNKVAVMSYKKNVIYIVSVGHKLTLDTFVDVKANCTGIACVDDKFVVTCADPVEVKILSMTGEVLQTLVTRQRASEIFIQPRHVAIDKQLQILYVSDFARNTVSMMDLKSGNVISVYASRDHLHGPSKLAPTKTGSVYICGYDSDNIHIVTPYRSKRQVVLQKSDGITRPQTISCCDVTGSVYVGMWRSEILNVYQLKEQ